jgi:2-amino-4-hydroxy-6-hydroxymethyldihydropteridine diphosphokinase
MGKLAYLALGSNVGDRVGNIQHAITLLTDSPSIQLLGGSSFYETEPLACDPDQPWFVNAVVAVETSLTPHQLLARCQQVETVMKRDRNPERPNGPRTLDIDILFYDRLMLTEPELIIPHPRLHQRACVLVPLLEISPNWVHPGLGQTITELHQALETPEDVVLYGTRTVA